MTGEPWRVLLARHHVPWQVLAALPIYTAVLAAAAHVVWRLAG